MTKDQQAVIVTIDAAAKLHSLPTHSELIQALRDLDACYCEASDGMSRAQRAHHREVLTRVRQAVAKVAN